jgi:hypothetical protein
VEEHAFFVEHGWIVLRGAVAPRVVAEIEREVDRLFPESMLAADHVHESVGLSSRSDVIARQVHDAAIAARVAALLGCERVQLLQDTVLVKAARSAARVEWHQDHTYTGYLEPAAAVSVRLALTPCTRSSGCLEVIGGSHRHGLLGEVRALTARSVEDASSRLPGDWTDRVIAVELEPGDLSVHHCLTAHRSGVNSGAFARKTLIARLFDARCTLAAERLPPGARSWFLTDDAGHLDARRFPLLQ